MTVSPPCVCSEQQTYITKLNKGHKLTCSSCILEERKKKFTQINEAGNCCRVCFEPVTFILLCCRLYSLQYTPKEAGFFFMNNGLSVESFLNSFLFVLVFHREAAVRSLLDEGRTRNEMGGQPHTSKLLGGLLFFFSSSSTSSATKFYVFSPKKRKSLVKRTPSLVYMLFTFKLTIYWLLCTHILDFQEA